MAISTNCWKYLVLTFNVLFAVSAVVLFGASGFLLYRLFVYRHFIGVDVEYPAILLLMMSIITCSIAWIGWRTARSMHQIHVIITGILIVLVVIIEFSCFVWALVVWDNIEIDIISTMNGYFKQTIDLKDSNSADMIRWDRLHMRFECCGLSGPTDFSSTGQVPFSCCGQGPLDALHKPYTSDCSSLYQRGCGKPLHEYARQQLLLVAMTALTASILQRAPLGPFPTAPHYTRGLQQTVNEYARQQLLLVAMTALTASILQSTGIFCTFFLAHSIKERRRASIRNSTSARESTFAAPDDSLLAPTAPAPTLPKY